MKKITFSKKKKNHIYVGLDENQNYVEVENPEKGKRYFEFAMVAGG